MTINRLNALINTLNHNSTRDLAWAIFAPDLLQHSSIASLSPHLTQTRIDWILDLDANPNQLENALYHGHSLGRYYESLWCYFFQHDAQYEIRGHNIPVKDHQRTIGEFDFIIKDRQTDRFIHHETAVKFYLFYTTNSSQEATNKNLWLGPDSSDTLERKWNHLTNHQVRLSDHNSAKEVLSHLGIQRIENTIAFKGYLFSPVNQGITPEEYINENTLFDWIRADELLLNSKQHRTIALIPRRRWLTRRHTIGSLELIDNNTLISRVTQAKIPLLAAYVQNDGACLQEENRFFIIPENWP